jgi:hypothetical protein
MRLVGLGFAIVVVFPGTVLAEDMCRNQCDMVGEACVDACGYFECEEKCLRDQKECVATCPAPSGKQPLWLARLARLSPPAITSPQRQRYHPFHKRTSAKFVVPFL